MDRLIIEDQRDAEVLRWVQLAVCADTDRPSINGMYVINEDGETALVGVDGVRIHTWTGDSPEPLAEVPTGTVLRINYGQNLAKDGWRVYPCEILDDADFPIDRIHLAKPKGRLRAVIKVNPGFLRDALEVPIRHEYNYVTLRIYGSKGDPVIVESKLEGKVIGSSLVMPMSSGLSDEEDARLVEDMMIARRAQTEMNWVREHYPDVAMEAEEKARKEEKD